MKIVSIFLESMDFMMNVNENTAHDYGRDLLMCLIVSLQVIAYQIVEMVSGGKNKLLCTLHITYLLKILFHF